MEKWLPFILDGVYWNNLFLLSLKMQFLMMLKYFAFSLCSRIAHIGLLLKFLLKIVVLRMTSNLYVVKAIWLHFLSGQLHLFFISLNFTFLWIAVFLGGSNFLFLCMYKFIPLCSLWILMTWDLLFLHSAWLQFFYFSLTFAFREYMFKFSSHLRYLQLCLSVAALMVLYFCQDSL